MSYTILTDDSDDILATFMELAVLFAHMLAYMLLYKLVHILERGWRLQETSAGQFF